MDAYDKEMLTKQDKELVELHKHDVCKAKLINIISIKIKNSMV